MKLYKYLYRKGEIIFLQVSHFLFSSFVKMSKTWLNREKWNAVIQYYVNEQYNYYYER